MPEPAVGGCCPGAVEPAAPDAAALRSDRSSVVFAGGAVFGAFAPRRALREVVLFADEEVDVVGAASTFAFGDGAGATPLSWGTGAGATELGAALVSGDGTAAGEFAVGGFWADGDELVWSATPGVTGGGGF